MNPLEPLLRTIREKTLAVVISITEPPMRAVSDDGIENPFVGLVAKLSILEVVLNANYQAAVNQQRKAEGKEPDFLARARIWGVHVPNTPLVEHKGQLYLEYQGRRVFDVAYRLDGQPIEECVLEPWLKKSSPSKTQDLDAQVVVRTVKLDNLLAVVPTAALPS